MPKKNSGDRNSPNPGLGQMRDRLPRLPTFERNEEFSAGIARLARAYEVMNSGSPTGRCNFQSEGDIPCMRRLVGNHSIQEKILDRIADRGHVKTFPRDIRNVKNRIIDENPEHRDPFTAQGRWTPADVGVNEASKYRFFCDLHDNQVFRSIERTESDPYRHPLDEVKLTPQQYFLLSYRILLRVREESNGARRAFEMSLRANQRRTRPYALARMRHTEIAKGLDAIRQLFDERYRSGLFDSFIEAPVDAGIELPVQLAVADLYEPHQNANGLFLTVHPLESESDDDGPYEHRVITTRLRIASRATTSTLRTLDKLLEGAGQSESGSENFLAGVLRSVRNAFVSRHYERHLPERTRRTIEQQVCANVLEGIREWFPGTI